MICENDSWKPSLKTDGSKFCETINAKNHLDFLWNSENWGDS